MASLEKFVVLRSILDTPRPIRTFNTMSPLGAPKGLTRHPADLGLKKAFEDNPNPRFSIEVASLRRTEADDARRDPKTIGIAASMRTALVTPVASATDDEGSPWGVEQVGAVTSPYNGEDVKVAILDTGIHREHQAFAKVQITSEDFTGEGDSDSHGHGTHCAGIAFGGTVGGRRLGVAPGVSKAYAGKVLRGDGSGDTEMLFRGLDGAMAFNADVISMSLGFDFPGMVRELVAQQWPIDLATSQALVVYRDNLRLFDNLMERFRLLAPYGRGAVIVAASGNESKADGNPDYRIAVSLPAAATGVVSVGALQRSGAGLIVPYFSNTMPRVSAPGVGIVSAQAKTAAGLVSMDGTSMACPHVAGVAALWWDQLRRSGEQATPLKVEARLLTSVRTNVFAAGVRPIDRGDGLVSAPPKP